MTILIALVGFIFISLLVIAGGMALAPSGGTAIERRLGEVTSTRVLEQHDDTPADPAVLKALKRMGAMAPRSAKELGKLQQRLVVAGYRKREALGVFFGIRLAVAVAFFAVASMPIFATPNLAMALAAAGLGWVLPGIALARMARKRQHVMRLGLPDALDLLVVSVEAGLGLDQALQRVSEELAFAHPDLCDELRLINLELRAGTARADALHNLARRTDMDDVQSLVTMLVQTDKFGTSVAVSLRVHSETLRTKRRQRAEEKAAKLGVKLLFPLVFCLFPAFYLIVLGPSMLQIFRQFVYGNGL